VGKATIDPTVFIGKRRRKDVKWKERRGMKEYNEMKGEICKRVEFADYT
jgi:hypothetical protein